MNIQFPQLEQIACARRVLVFNSKDSDLVRSEFMTRRLLYCANEIQTLDAADSSAHSIEETTQLTRPDVAIIFENPNKAKILTATVQLDKYEEEIYEFKKPVELVEKVLSVKSLNAKTPENLNKIYTQSKDAIVKYAVFENDDTTGNRFEIEKQSYELDSDNPEVAWRYAVDLIERNIEKTKQQDFQLAVKILEKINQTNPLYGRLYLSAGIAYGRLADFKSKIKCYETADAMLTWNPWPRHNLGVTYFNDLKDARKAIHYFESSLALCVVKKVPAIPETYYNLYVCYNSLREKSPGDFNTKGLKNLEEFLVARFSKYIAEYLDKNDYTPFTYPRSNDNPNTIAFIETVLKLAEEYNNQKGKYAQTATPRYFELYLKATWPTYFEAIRDSNYEFYNQVPQEQVSEFGAQISKLIDMLIQVKDTQHKTIAMQYSLALQAIFPGDESVLEQRKKLM